MDPEEQEISKQMEALKVTLEHKRRAKIVRPLTPAPPDEFVEAPGNAKWMREATASLKKFLESNEGDKGETLAKELWEVMLVSKDSYKEKYRSGGHSVTGGSHKGTGKQPQSRVTARCVKELERLGARTWIEATRKGRFRFAEWENITYYCTARGDNAYDVAKGPQGPAENVATTTAYGTAKADSPRKGGDGGAWQRVPQTGSLGMTEKWRWKVKRTRFPGSGLHTGICASRHLPPTVTSSRNHGLRERQPGDARRSGHLRPTISLRGTPRRATLGIPHALGHPQTAPHLGRPMGGWVRGDAAREEVDGRTGYGAVGEGRESVHVLPGNKVDGQHKPSRMKSLMGVGGGRVAGAWVTYKGARSCAWSASRRVEQVSDIPRNELFRATLAVILRARERLRDVEGGQAHLERILSHMDALQKLSLDHLGQDYDRYDGDGPSVGISEGMRALERGAAWKSPWMYGTRTSRSASSGIYGVGSRGWICGRFDVWQPFLHTRRMIGVLVGDGFLCRDPGCLGAHEWEDLTDNVSAFVKPKNDVKCSFIIDMRNRNDCSKVPLRKVKSPSIHTVFQTIQGKIHQGAPLWGITLEISNFYWSLQIPAEHRGLNRIQGAHFHCLPFGWRFSPVLAQDTLAALLREFCDNHAVGLDIHRFHYLHDVLILSRDRECMEICAVTRPFLAQNGREIQSKQTNKGKLFIHFTCALIAL